MADLEEVVALARVVTSEPDVDDDRLVYCKGCKADWRADFGCEPTPLCTRCSYDALDTLGRFFVDTFDQSVPCGFEAPRVSRELHSKTLHVFWNVDDNDMAFAPDEAIALGAFLMAAGFDAKAGREP